MLFSPGAASQYSSHLIGDVEGGPRRGDEDTGEHGTGPEGLTAPEHGTRKNKGN